MRAEYIVAFVFIVICGVFDWKRKEIPVVIIGVFGVLALLLTGLLKETGWHMVAYSLIPGAAMLALSLCTRESIGYGDGFVVLVLGVLLGIAKCVAAVFAGLMLSAVCSAFLLVIRKVNGKSRLPYIPFLAVGLGVVLFG